MAATNRLVTREFSVVGVVADTDRQMLVRFTISGEAGHFAVLLPLPSSGGLKPWLYDRPTDAEDAAAMLRIFVMEEVDTGCVRWAALTTRGDDRMFEVAPYGFRRADAGEHRRLLRAAGPNGWHGFVTENSDHL